MRTDTDVSRCYGQHKSESDWIAVFLTPPPPHVGRQFVTVLFVRWGVFGDRVTVEDVYQNSLKLRRLEVRF